MYSVLPISLHTSSRLTTRGSIAHWHLIVNWHKWESGGEVVRGGGESAPTTLSTLSDGHRTGKWQEVERKEAYGWLMCTCRWSTTAIDLSSGVHTISHGKTEYTADRCVRCEAPDRRQCPPHRTPLLIASLARSEKYLF